MGVISDILGSIFGSGGEGSVHTSTRTTEYDNGDVRVRSVSYISEDGTENHNTIFSNATVNVNTGATGFKEGGHGENYKK